MHGNDVNELQIYLDTHGFPIAAAGPGSPGNETTYFGFATQAALAKFQTANEITPAQGYFGQKTRLLILLMSEVQELLAEIATLTPAGATSSSATSTLQ
jgi:peptidoglycan hydrolase-like protein with peptidoglycan-binding domain